MHPVLFSLFGRQVTGYWAATMMGLAVTHAFVSFTNRRGGQKRVPFVHVHNLNCLAILSIYIGGAVMGLLVRLPDLGRIWGQFQGDPGLMVKDFLDHRAFYGGLVLLGLTFWWYIRRYRLDGRVIGYLFLPACPLFMVFGRLGCHLGGCCYGIPVPWGITFPEGSLAPAGVPLFPSQLAEAAGQLGLFFLLVWLRKRTDKPLLWLCTYVCGYAGLRFVLEFFRGDLARGGWWGLSTSQWISLAAGLAMGAYLLHWSLATLGRNR